MEEIIAFGVTSSKANMVRVVILDVKLAAKKQVLLSGRLWLKYDIIALLITTGLLVMESPLISGRIIGIILVETVKLFYW